MSARRGGPNAGAASSPISASTNRRRPRPRPLDPSLPGLTRQSIPLALQRGERGFVGGPGGGERYKISEIVANATAEIFRLRDTSLAQNVLSETEGGRHA